MRASGCVLKNIQAQWYRKKKSINFRELARIDMAALRNSKDIAPAVGGADFSVIEIAKATNSLRNGAAQLLIAPTSFNGCISEVSSDTIRSCARDYASAMKSYGVIYEEYQSYLMPAAQTLVHDYDMAAQPVPDFGHLGCLNADLLDFTMPADAVSDDDIESCGYMAWVHH